MLFQTIIVFFFAFILNVILKKQFVERGFIDKINHRSSHESIAIRSGGVVIYFTVIAYSLYLYFLGEQPYDFSFLIPITILFFLGFYDDIKGLDFGLKFIFQIIAAKLIVDIGLVVDVFSIFGLEYSFGRAFSQIFSILIYVSLFNAYNFIDGINSNIHLESIKNILICLLIFDLSTGFSNLLTFLIVSLIVNLYFNNSKINVFTGDSGSLIIPVILLMSIYEGTLFNYDQNILKYTFIIFIYPIVDLTRVVLIRLINNKSPFLPDKNHIHHKLLSYNKSHTKSSMVIFILTLIIQLIFIYLLNIIKVA